MIGYGAANMIGRRNSVLSRLKDKQPHLFSLHCVCHVSHTCASDACKKLPDYLDTFSVELFWHFHCRELRFLENFKSSLKQLCTKFLSLVVLDGFNLRRMSTGPLSSGMLWKDIFGIVNQLPSKFMSLISYCIILVDFIQVSKTK